MNRSKDESELSKFQQEVGKWGKEVFGRENINQSIKSLITHLWKEVLELDKEANRYTFPTMNEKVKKELADCFILLLDISSLMSCDLLGEARKKMEINRSRTWGKPDKDGVIEHEREERPLIDKRWR